jgi:peptide/nickel transport system permease protein
MSRSKTALFGLVFLSFMILVALLADLIAPYSFSEQNLLNTLATPSLEHPFGTDEFGRDVLSRIIYGSRISLLVGFISVGIALVFGGLLGAAAGYFGGKTDHYIMRVMDVFLSIPQLLFAISVAASLGPGLGNLMLAVGVAAIPQYARVVRSGVLSIRSLDYIEASTASGGGSFYIIMKHVLPNCAAPLIVQSTLGVAFAILIAAGLSFIGLGLEPPNPEWGAMLSTGREYIRDFPHLTVFPGLAIMLTILSLNFLGDGLRDVLDPKLRR